MSRRKKNKQNTRSVLKNEVCSLLIIATGIFILISLQTQSTGELGKFIKNFLFGLLSKPAYLLPYLIILFGILLMIKKTNFFNKKTKVSIVLIYLSYIMLYAIFYRHNIPKPIFTFENLRIIYNQGIEKSGGGIIGSVLSAISLKFLGINGSYVFIFTIMLVSFMIITRISLVTIIMRCNTMILKFGALVTHSVIEFVKLPEEKNVTLKGDIDESVLNQELKTEPVNRDGYIDEKIKILDFTREVSSGIKINEAIVVGGENGQTQDLKNEQNEDHAEDIGLHIKQTKSLNASYVLPKPDLLVENASPNIRKDKKEILNKAKILEETLLNFGVDAKVTQASKGPTITRYEIQPSPGVKVSKIVSLSDDIALNLAAANIRIEAPIPGKAAVGIEIPNDNISTVTMKEVLQSDKFIGNDSKLTFVLGKDIAGNPVTADLAKMPHLLIAGATGSGKSVCINVLITSILFNAMPHEVKLLLIDPKVVELNNYNGIPHLLIPVVNDPKKASSALNWAVQEMANRYKSFASNNVRDINSYNEKMLREGKETLPKIVIIIDELADLMMVDSGQVEDAICRLAQMARAAGMHLIVATQRPSVDVITGVIKANIPSRIAFAVSSQADSRTILDMGGAEKLLGKGDMLFYPVGASKPKRIQGAFISDMEVENVVKFIKEQSVENNYQDDIFDKLENDYIQENNSVDELLEDAIELVVQAGQASISMLQRRFRIGYNRAARLIDAMEERKIIGEHEGSKPRQVLISKEEFEEMKSRI